MASPIQKQRLELLKKQHETSNQTVLVHGAEPKSLHLLLAELESDKKVLKGLNRIEDKVQHKRDELVPKYKPAIEEYLKSGEKFDNPLLADMVVWLFDIEELETAIDWCEQAIANELDLPFKRDFATFCADAVLAWSEKMSAQGHSIEPFFSNVFEKVRDEWRLNEKLTAKYYKFAGLFLLRDEDGKPKASSVGDVETLEKSLALLVEAENQDPKAGVSSQMDKINQRIRALKEGTNL